jgi:hypothetical protein
MIVPQLPMTCRSAFSAGERLRRHAFHQCRAPSRIVGVAAGNPELHLGAAPDRAADVKLPTDDGVALAHDWQPNWSAGCWPSIVTASMPLPGIADRQPEVPHAASGCSWPGRAEVKLRLVAGNLPLAGATSQDYRAHRERRLLAGSAHLPAN